MAKQILRNVTRGDGRYEGDPGSKRVAEWKHWRLSFGSFGSG
jgi:hypothetical protein